MTDCLHILFCSAEVAPFSKAGGLADVAGSLPPALSAHGVQVTVISPLYGKAGSFNTGAKPKPFHSGTIQWAETEKSYTIKRLQYRNVEFLFVDEPDYFGRDGIYTDTSGKGYADNGARFLFFQSVILDLIRQKVVTPDLIHVNDHHTALLPLFLQTEGIELPSLITLHNLGYAGHLPPEDVDRLPSELKQAVVARTVPGAWVNPLKIGIETAGKVNTVSPTYAKEVLVNGKIAPDLAEALKQRGSDFTGILNGIDTEVWNPAMDPNLAENYDKDSLSKKQANRKALLEQCGLEVADDKPLFGSVSRLVETKGFDLIIAVLPELADSGAGFVFLGNGDAKYRMALQSAAKAHRSHIFFSTGYDEPLAHRIEAGADIFLMPSELEPCGLNQMYSLRYGTLPVVHATGGLADSVTQWDRPGGCGFVFEPWTLAAFRQALKQTAAQFKNRKQWNILQRNGMDRDFSWKHSAGDYKNLYIALLNRGPKT